MDRPCWWNVSMKYDDIPFSQSKYARTTVLCVAVSVIQIDNKLGNDKISMAGLLPASRQRKQSGLFYGLSFEYCVECKHHEGAVMSFRVMKSVCFHGLSSTHLDWCLMTWWIECWSDAIAKSGWVDDLGRIFICHSNQVSYIFFFL